MFGFAPDYIHVNHFLSDDCYSPQKFGFKTTDDRSFHLHLSNLQFNVFIKNNRRPLRAQPRSQGPLSTSRKYPGYGWSRVYTCQLQTHRGWVLNKLQLQLQLSSPSLRSYLWNLLKSSRHVTSRNQGTFSR